jgi:quinol monooxygenase YgiN
MFVVHGTFPISPESADELRAALTGLQAATRAESGCLSYEWAESVESPGTFHSIETWDSRASHDQHMTTDAVQAAVANLPGWLSGAPALVGYETAEEIALPL